MSAFAAILLGLIRGATFFLPLSYSGHTAAFEGFGLSIRPDALYSLLLSISSIASIVIFYGGALRKMGGDTVAFFTGRYDNPLGEGRLPTTVRTALFSLVALLPSLVLSFFRKHAVTLSDKVWFVCFAMIVLGVLIYTADRFAPDGDKRDRTITVFDALLVGVGYALGAIPGLSPVGLAVAIGLTRGLNREYAARFSVLLTVFPLALSCVTSVLRMFRESVSWSSLPWYIIGCFLSVILGALSIGLLNRLLNRKALHRTSYYIGAFGIAALIISLVIG